MQRVRFVRAGVLSITAGLALCFGCDSKTSPPAGGVTTTVALPAGLILAAAPEGSQSVEAAKESAAAGKTITMRGRIGGSLAPFVPGRAVFTLMGDGLESCSDNPDDKCATPWDYCCEQPKDIALHAATVQVLDATGAPLKADLKGRNGIKELSEVVVVGTVAVADGGTLVVNATGIFVAKP